MLEYTEYLQRRSNTPADLTQIISELRSRWRLKLALRGVARSVGVAVVLFVVAAYGMEWAAVHRLLDHRRADPAGLSDHRRHFLFPRAATQAARHR